MKILKWQNDYNSSEAFLRSLMDILLRYKPIKIKLKNLINSCENNQMLLNLVHVVLSCKRFENVDDNVDTNQYCRNLLCNNIIAAFDREESLELENKFKKNLKELEDSYDLITKPLIRDEILIFILDKINSGDSFLSIFENVNEFILLLKGNFKSVERLLVDSFGWLDEVKMSWIISIIQLKYRHISAPTLRSLNIDASEASEIANLLLDKLKFGVYESECFLERLFNLQNISQLVSLLIYVYAFLNKHNCINDFKVTNVFPSLYDNRIVISTLPTMLSYFEREFVKIIFLKEIVPQIKCIQIDAINDNYIIERISNNLKTLRKQNWSFEAIIKLLKVLDMKISVEPIELREQLLVLNRFSNVLSIIINYEIQEDAESLSKTTVQSILKNVNFIEWPTQMQKFAVLNTFNQILHEKNLNEVLAEIQEYVISSHFSFF